MADDDKWCFAWFGDDDRATQGRSRAAATRRFLWAPGDEIFIAYQEDGDPEEDRDLRELVEKYAPEWMQYANVTLTFIDDPDDADIRISFRFPGCWSTVGNSCKTEPRERPTMNFNAARMRRSNAAVARGVVLHEFGHALGLIHEHQHPQTPLEFNRRQVIADVSRPPNNWSEAKIERNIFAPAIAGETNAGVYDPDSIMMYPIPPHWLMNPEESTEENHDLSDADIAFIATQYPKHA